MEARKQLTGSELIIGRSTPKMANLFEVLFDQILSAKTKPGIALIATKPNSEKQPLLPNSAFPENWGFHVWPDDPLDFSSLTGQGDFGGIDRLYVLPPFQPYRQLRRDLASKYPQRNLDEIVLLTLAQNLPSGALLAFTVFQNFVFSETRRAARTELFTALTPRLVISHDSTFAPFLPEMHTVLRFATCVTVVGPTSPGPIRFFQCFDIDNGSRRQTVEADFQTLLRLNRGRTRHGFVRQEPIPLGQPLSFDLYDPDFLEQQEGLSSLGNMERLGDLVDPVRTLHAVRDANLLLPGDSGQGIPVIEGRDITQSGVNTRDTRYRVDPAFEQQLRAGDICGWAVGRTDGFRRYALIEQDMLPLAAMSTVNVLRPKAVFAQEDASVLVAYLNSDAFRRLCQAQSFGVSISHVHLLDLPVPVPDDSVRMAIRDIDAAGKQFRAWHEESERERSMLFDTASNNSVRQRILAVGQRTRQRLNVARLVDDAKFRFRTQLPHPLAARWRSVESAIPSMEGYGLALEAAETTAAYLAYLAITCARVQGLPIGYLKTIAARIDRSGTNMGDWLAVLQEIHDSKAWARLPDAAPFTEVTRIYEGATREILKDLKERRDDQAHGRGPKGGEVEQEFRVARDLLEKLLTACEFLVDYPLRWVETTRRDSLRKVTLYDYRDLMGDYNFPPLQSALSVSPEIEAQSLYLSDRNGDVHLMRPLLVRRRCSRCLEWTTLHLDSFRRDTGVCLLKSMEHGHSGHREEDSSVLEGFQNLGLIEKR